jgi:hypothetical protein
VATYVLESTNEWAAISSRSDGWITN